MSGGGPYPRQAESSTFPRRSASVLRRARIGSNDRDRAGTGPRRDRRAARLVPEFIESAFTVDPDAASAPTFNDLEAEIASLPGKFAPPTGAFLIAKLDGIPVGSVAFHDLDAGVVELKRMYIRPDARGNRIGEHLVVELVEEVRRREKRKIVLDSHHRMTSAHRIYREAGFRDVPAPADFPKWYLGKVVFMVMSLV